MNILYNIMKRATAVIAVALCMASCLSKMPGDAIHESQGMKTFADAEQTLTGIYSSYMSGALYSGYLTLLPDIQADLVHAVQGNSNTYGPVWEWDIRPTNAEILGVYGSLYSVIGRCNFYLDKVGELRASLTNDDDITYLDYYTGEVYCARANAYMELIKCFCKAYDSETAVEPEGGVALDSTYFGAKPLKRSTLKESYDFVVRDLKKAEELLEEDFDYYTNPYVTNAAAKVLRARAALYTQDFDEAIRYATEVIDNDAFALSTASAYTTAVDPMTYTSRVYTYLDYMWTHDLSTEVIWQIGYTVTSYGGSLGQVFLNFNNDYTYYYPDYMPSDWVIGLYGGSDARLTAYFRTLTTGYSGNPALNLLVKYFGNQSTFIPNNIYHVCQPKPMRLAELYLIRAEAYCRSTTQKNLSNAAADLKTLAAARGVSAAGLSDNNWLARISEERVKELYMEGFRLNDLKRWIGLDEWKQIQSDKSVAFKRVSQASAQNGPGSTLEIKTDDHRFVWPIPKHEVEAPGSQIKQNSGY